MAQLNDFAYKQEYLSKYLTETITPEVTAIVIDLYGHNLSACEAVLGTVTRKYKCTTERAILFVRSGSFITNVERELRQDTATIVRQHEYRQKLQDQCYGLPLDIIDYITDKCMNDYALADKVMKHMSTTKCNVATALQEVAGITAWRPPVG